MREDQTSEPRKKLGKYEIESVLGQGAMGTVYKGFDPLIRRTVALKTVRKDLLDSKDADTIIARFKQEAQAAGRLMHPNIVAVHEYGEDESNAFIAMEYVPGRELRDFFDEDAVFCLEDVVQIMTQLLDALSYSHKNGVIHRDIKHSNIIVMADGKVKVADFGIARVESSNLTQTGTVIGTPGYMSPEQYTGQQTDGRSDIFSAGVILYQLITREKPFAGQSMATVMHNVLNTEPVSPSKLNVQIFPAFDAVIRKALAKRPMDRFQTADEFAKAIQQAASGVPFADKAASDDEAPTLIMGADKKQGQQIPGSPSESAVPAESEDSPKDSDDAPTVMVSRSGHHPAAKDKQGQRIPGSQSESAALAESEELPEDSPKDSDDAPTVMVSRSERHPTAQDKPSDAEEDPPEDATVVVKSVKKAEPADVPKADGDADDESVRDMDAALLKSKRVAFVGAGIVVVLMLLGIGWGIFFAAKETQEVVKEKAAVTDAAMVRVETSPVGAGVFLNTGDFADNAPLKSLLDEGEFKGKTPLDLELAPGRYELTLKKDGYYDVVSELEVASGAEMPFKVELIKTD